MPRFFTARECARLQGFPESHILGEVGEAGGKGNGNRLYYQLGNAVCPVVVAAIANSLLAVIGLLGEPPGGVNKGVLADNGSDSVNASAVEGGSIGRGGGGGATRAVVETADPHMLDQGPNPRRNLSAPAIRLLLHAMPDPSSAHYALTGRSSLFDQCASFLRCEEGAPGGSTGCGDCFTAADAETVGRLLATGQPRALADGLHSLGRVALMEPPGWAAILLEANLLPLMVQCLR
mmetsp:Transcript_69879/g.195402  ORF Transcript_69879/g.195402 Transcript_69879/m.195402 type:complete len:235 (-) Transcript_69879:706-1410(-)